MESVGTGDGSGAARTGGRLARRGHPRSARSSAVLVAVLLLVMAMVLVIAVRVSPGGARLTSELKGVLASSSAGGDGSCTTTAVADDSADCYSASRGPVSVQVASGDSDPAGVNRNQAARLANGTWLKYEGVNFGSGSSKFDARVASGAPAGVIGLVEVVLDNPVSTPVGSFAVANTGGWSSWATVHANISTVTGIHDVYLEFFSQAAGSRPFVSLHYFDFPAS